MANIATLATVLDAIVYDGGVTKGSDDMGLLNGLGIPELGMVWDSAVAPVAGAPVAGAPSAPVCIGRPEQGGMGNRYWLLRVLKGYPMPVSTPGMDNSTLYDVWAMGKDVSSGLDGDPDNDGISNKLEYLEGTDPAVPNADTVAVSIGTNGDLVMTFTWGDLASEDGSAHVGLQDFTNPGSGLFVWKYFKDKTSGGSGPSYGTNLLSVATPFTSQRRIARFYAVYPSL